MADAGAAVKPRARRPRAAKLLFEPAPKKGLERITESRWFKSFIFVCIVVNALLLGYDAHFWQTNPYRGHIELWNQIFLALFTVELAMEMTALGPRRWSRSGWNWFDLVIVAVSWLSAVPGVTALRVFRVVRVFRLVSNVPQMQRVIEALVRALPGVFATLSILVIVFYIGAIMATTFFGERFPLRFGDLQLSALSLFQLTLFDEWGAIVTEVGKVYPSAWLFFLGFTVLSAFAMLNLFIGVIVDAVQEARAAELSHEVKEIEREVMDIEEGVEDIAESQEDVAQMQRRILEEVRSMRAELNELKAGGPPPPG